MSWMGDERRGHAEPIPTPPPPRLQADAAAGQDLPVGQLLDPTLLQAIGRLEAAGGVKRAEAEVDPVAIASAHERYAAERDAAIATDHDGPRPFGGVGGTRRGVKCLHAHYAWYLAGGDDPVGRWVAERLGR